MGPPPDHQGSDGGSQYWAEEGGYQEGWRRPGQDFHGDPRGHRGGSGGQWENQERFSSHNDDYERSVKQFADTQVFKKCHIENKLKHYFYSGFGDL